MQTSLFPELGCDGRRGVVPYIAHDDPELEIILSETAGSAVILDGDGVPSHKLCASCRAVLSVDRFSRRTTSRDGRQSWCKKCLTGSAAKAKKSSSRQESDWWAQVVSEAQASLGDYLGGSHFVYVHGWPSAQAWYVGETETPGMRNGWNARHMHLDARMLRHSAVWAVCCRYGEHVADMALTCSQSLAGAERVNVSACAGSTDIGTHEPDCPRRLG